MNFTEPFAAYDAADNLEAHFVCNLLNDSDIEAAVVEDAAEAGGLVWENYKPQVWIEQKDAERARVVLDEYERRGKERQVATPTGETIQATCEECGTQSSFPASQKGSVQDCPHCHAFVDVGSAEDFNEWNESADAEPTE